MTTKGLDLVKVFGEQGMTAEDRNYAGSRYGEVRDALLANPYREGRFGQEPAPLPMFRSSISNVWAGLFRGQNHFRQASARTLDSRADLRWGADGKGYRRIIAPNGICVLGEWQITEDTRYTGYYAKGAKGLAIGRFSSDGNETKRGQRRSISLGLKIYPTTDPAHTDPLVPASVIVQEDLGGMRTDHLNDAELVNKPNVTVYRRGIYMLIMLRANMVFGKLDKVPDSRQAFQPAEIGTAPGTQTISPEHLRLKMTPGQSRIDGKGLDFRDEIYRFLFQPGEETPSGQIEFDIAVSDYGRKSGIPGFSRVKVDDWRSIGKLRFTECVASYNADHVIHFHHPKWRDDRNDPRTYIRDRETRVRR